MSALSMFAKVSRPYTSGSRVPSMFRFGPWITKIFIVSLAPRRYRRVRVLYARCGTCVSPATSCGIPRLRASSATLPRAPPPPPCSETDPDPASPPISPDSGLIVLIAPRIAATDPDSLDSSPALRGTPPSLHDRDRPAGCRRTHPATRARRPVPRDAATAWDGAQRLVVPRPPPAQPAPPARA